MLVTRQVKFDPKFINEDIIKTLVEITKKCFERTSSKEDGIIKRVNYLKRIVSNEISKTTGHVIFIVELDVDLVYPKVGDVFNMYIIRIDSKAIFVEDDAEVFKAIVSADNITDFEFNKTLGTFVNKEHKLQLRLKDKISIIITAMKYENNMFKYVGKLN